MITLQPDRQVLSLSANLLVQLWRHLVQSHKHYVWKITIFLLQQDSWVCQNRRCHKTSCHTLMIDGSFESWIPVKSETKATIPVSQRDDGRWWLQKEIQCQPNTPCTVSAIMRGPGAISTVFQRMVTLTFFFFIFCYPNYTVSNRPFRNANPRTRTRPCHP